MTDVHPLPPLNDNRSILNAVSQWVQDVRIAVELDLVEDEIHPLQHRAVGQTIYTAL